MRADDIDVASSSPPAWWRDEPMAPLQRSTPEWRSIVMDAYAMQPTLSITCPQGERLWGMNASTCRYVLDGLVDAGVLIRTTAGQYCRADYIQPIDPVFAM